MHILITDSGVGGLSVVAYAERHIRVHGAREPVSLTFANAAPANDYGYNSMPTREEKLATFDRFLRNVTERFAPDMIYVACNTLSVLLPDTPFLGESPIPIEGIVETGVKLLMAELEDDPRLTAIIFGTKTTVDAGTYPRMLNERGIDASRIVSQACPGLADTISEDREGSRSAAEIRRWVAEALKNVSGSPPVVALLACTHYGYRKDLFDAAFAGQGIPARVINPNEQGAVDLIRTQDHADGEAAAREAEVRFVTRYAIPDSTIEALSFFLNDISPPTVEALRNYAHEPDLF